MIAEFARQGTVNHHISKVVLVVNVDFLKEGV